MNHWVFLLTGTFWSVAVIAGLGETAQEDGWGIALFAGVFLVGAGLVPALLFHLWARHADRERVRPVAAGVGPTAPVPCPGFQDPIRERRP